MSSLETRHGQNLVTLHGDTDGVKAVVFGPDEKTLASASASTVWLWDLILRKEIAVLPGHDEDDDGATAVVFSSDDMTLATSDGDGTVPSRAHGPSRREHETS